MDSIKKKRKQNFQTIFIKYSVYFCLMTLMLMLVTVLLLGLGIYTGFILEANYVETEIEEAYYEIKTADKVTTDIVPELCDYAVFTIDGEYLYGSLDFTLATNAWVFIKQKTSGITYPYLVIERDDEICILKYELKAKFASPLLRKVLPNAEITLIVIFIISFIIGSALLAFYFGKTLKNKMKGLQEATKKIQEQDLDFSIQSSGVYEIDDVLISMDKMKDALKSSLHEQWKLEQTKKEQISALAHDIKTPLTIIRGNAELLMNVLQDDVQKEYTQYIYTNANQIEKYIKQLIDIAKMQNDICINCKWIDTDILLKEIESQIKALALIKNIDLKVEINSLPKQLYLDKELFIRAIINVIDNAVEHTPNEGIIIFTVKSDEKTVQFQISDSGLGFSEVDLKEATKQFYMSNKSRSIANHYGMGLFITDSIIKQHRGVLELSNSTITGGGQVTIVLPLF